MKKLIIKICDCLFVAWYAGYVFSMIMLIVSGHPIRSAGAVLLSIGMMLLFSNVEIILKRYED